MARDFFSGGSPSYLRNATTVVTAVPLSFAAFGNTDSAGSSAIIVAITGGNMAEVFRLSATTKATATTTAGASSATASSSTTISDGTWYSFVGTFSSASSRAAYLDGGGKGTNATSRTPSGIVDTGVGLDYGGSGGPWDGKLSDPGVWSVALSDDEAAAHGKFFSPLLVRLSGLENYWQVIGRQSPEPPFFGELDLLLEGTPAVADHPRVFMAF